MSDESEEFDKNRSDAKNQASPNARGPFEWEDGTASLSLHEAIKDARRQIDADEATEQLSVRDVRLAALIQGLQENNQLADIAAEAGAALGRDTDDDHVTRAETLRLLIRVGLEKAAPETIQTAVEANKEYIVNQADEF